LRTGTGADWHHPDFEIVDHPGARVLARPEAAAWVRYILEGGKTLHGAAAEDRGALAWEGREPVYVIPAKVPPEARVQDPGRWAVRHYVRGGHLVSGLLGDQYLRSGRVRPFHETRASETARARGIPTPRVVAAALYTTRFFYRADLVTEFIPDASDLAEALFETRRKGVGGAVERQDALRTSGELIREMARSGIRHKDLHAGNILLRWEGAAPRPYLLDLDRCDVEPRATPVPPEFMLRRLQRSLGKWEGRTGLRLTEKEWETLEGAVQG
jgi:3-deoxy-D-manno-octulosonic acid kinase